MSPHRRIALIRKVMTGDNLSLIDRIGATLLLYAQPIRRLIRLTIHDVLADSDPVTIRLSDPTPVPEPSLNHSIYCTPMNSTSSRSPRRPRRSRRSIWRSMSWTRWVNISCSGATALAALSALSASSSCLRR
jgi:hypothetical protein